MEISTFLPQLRQVIAWAAGALVAYGYLDQSMVEPIIGIILGVGNAGWVYYTQRQKNKVITAVAQSPVALSVVPEDVSEKVKKAV